MDIKVKLLMLVVVILTISVIVYVMIFGMSSETSNFECSMDNGCVLSLCDCECYPIGKTPEELQGIVCGKNCAEWFNVSGCECISNHCTEVTE